MGSEKIEVPDLSDIGQSKMTVTEHHATILILIYKKPKIFTEGRQ